MQKQRAGKRFSFASTTFAWGAFMLLLLFLAASACRNWNFNTGCQELPLLMLAMPCPGFSIFFCRSWIARSKIGGPRWAHIGSAGHAGPKGVFGIVPKLITTCSFHACTASRVNRPALSDCRVRKVSIVLHSHASCPVPAKMSRRARPVPPRSR